MKTYCTQNNGNCTTCSLVHYGRDCNNTKLFGDPIVDASDNFQDLASLLAACREELDRIERYAEIILGDLPKYARVIEALMALNVLRAYPII